MEIGQIINKLRQVAGRLVSNVETQQDLVQEMYVHFVELRTREPDRHLAWYIRGCEFHARNRLRLGRSVDSPKRANGAVSWDSPNLPHCQTTGDYISQTETAVMEGELITSDVMEQLMPLLNERQKFVLQHLMEGESLRSIGRRLGITHPAVIKHRRKIAQIAHSILNEQNATSMSGSTHIAA